MLIGIHKYKLDTETGEFTTPQGKGIIPLTGKPIMMSWDIVHNLAIHYSDHIDCFHYSFTCIDQEYTFKPLSIGDPTYLGHCHETMGSCAYFKKGSDLVCGQLNEPGHPVEYKNFFDNCRVLLFVTNPEFNFLPHEPPLDHVPHYIDLQGNVHGRNPVYVKTGEYYIIFDVYLCICDDNGRVCTIMDHEQKKYQEVTKLTITCIDIFPGICQIFAVEGRFILDSQGVHRDAELRMTLRPTGTKSARK